MKKLEYYVPKSHVKITNQALFDVGAGRIGNYDCCCFVSEGMGQFRPLAGSNPFVGQSGEIHYEPEVKVEMVFEDGLKEQMVTALKAAHPYETPAYGIYSSDL